ncbi:MAG: SagB/ThcOx family dehydrogenase [Gammaproteobacteria bacterium]|nr:SagB/ThcOx family dehydrogenase [Gammaproteobacteria bacterium]
MVKKLCCLLATPTALLATCALAQSGASIELPEPRYQGELSVEQALQTRRSVRSYDPRALTLDEISQLLWAAQGLKYGEFRTAPSAGALYPLEVHLVAGNIEGMAPGVYRYDPASHRLREVLMGDVRDALASSAYGQDWVADAPAALIFSAVYERSTGKYGKRGIRYAHMEAGHAGQNVYLQARALGLGTVVVGAFTDSRVKKVLRMAADEQPLSIMPVGQPPG